MIIWKVLKENIKIWMIDIIIYKNYLEKSKKKMILCLNKMKRCNGIKISLMKWKRG